MLEKGRAQMQNQFDSWYNNLQARGGALTSGVAGAAAMPGGSPAVAPVKVTSASFPGDMGSQVNAMLLLRNIFIFIS